MKKLLLTVVAFAALALPADADSLPKEVLGKWCYMPDDESGTSRERRGSGPTSNGSAAASATKPTS